MCEQVIMENLYNILGISQTASKEEIKKVYREKVKELHPDKNCGKESEEFIKVTIAYNILIDDMRRLHYNDTGDIDDINNYNEKAIAKDVISKHIITIINQVQVNLQEIDIFYLIKDSVKNSLTTIKENIESIDNILDRCNIIKKRISGKDDFFITVIDEHKKQLKKDLFFLDRELKLCKNILEILVDYKYKTDIDSDIKNSFFSSFTKNSSTTTSSSNI